MKHIYGIALFLALLAGCSQTEAPPLSGFPVSDVTVNDTTVNIAEPLDTGTITTEPEAVEVEATENWIPLFDGESLEGWSMPVFGGDGEVEVRGGNLVIGRGAMMTGIRYEREFPTINYEIRYEARRTQGFDFFAACTFPVGESFCTFINGGWGGGLTGLSSINGFDASENETARFYDYRDNIWHRFHIQVMDDMIQVWITAQDREGNWGEEESVIRLATEGKELSTRFEADLYKPLGFTTWSSEGQLRNIEYRLIER